jgi:hypothetical protein
MKRPFVVLSALVLVLAACGDQSPVAPHANPVIQCRPPAELTAMVTGAPFAPVAMRSALQHAADKMSTALGGGTDVRALQDAITIVGSDIGASSNDGACRSLTIAYGALKALPDAPETLPDRDEIRLILALTAQALVAVVQQ